MRFLVCFSALLLLLGAPSFAAEPLNKIVAVVNGEMITSYDLETAAAPEVLKARLDPKNAAHAPRIRAVKNRVLEAMINEVIMAQEAERLKVSVSESDVDVALQQFKERGQLSDDEFQRQLQLQNLTPDDFRKRIRKTLLRNRLLSTMVGRKVVVTKEEIAEYYEAHRDSLQTERRVNVAILVYPPSVPAEKWAKRLKSGEVDFRKTARELSVGPKAAEGGELGEIAWQDLAPALRARLESLKPGQVSDPFVINNLQAQLKLLSVTSGAPQSLEEASAHIENILREPKLEERYQEYSSQLRRRAVVDVRL